jgi:type IV pilus assembly protein PilM
MSMVSGISDFFGLDIGTSALRLVQLKGTGDQRTLVTYGQLPLEDNISQSDAEADKQKVVQAIQALMEQAKVTTKNVAVGLPSSKVFTTLVDIDKLSDAEVEQTIKLQADSLIPTPLDESKLDWSILGPSVKDPNKLEVLLSSVNNNYAESRLDMLESIGLNVIAFEQENLAATRALTSEGVLGMTMIVDIGKMATDIVVTIDGTPRLTRSIATGSNAIIKSAMQNLNIDYAQAEQFVYKFGMSKDKLEGQIGISILGTVDILTSEIEKSINFVKSRYADIGLDRIIVTGGASTLPEFPLHIANKFSVNVEIGNAWRNVSFPEAMKSDLLAVSNHFAAAVGLAERKE